MAYDIPELLANLNPPGLESVLWNSRGEVPKLDPMTIAHALSRVRTKGAGYLLRVKYAGEQAWWSELEYCLYWKVIDLATKKGWTYPAVYKGREPLRGACRLALWEKVHPHVCPTCLGRASVIIDSRLILCDTCNGTMRVIPDDNTRMTYLGIGDDWSDFPQRYQRIMNILTGWELDGLTKMSQALFGKRT
jgi:hypothetical protein